MRDFDDLQLRDSPEPPFHERRQKGVFWVVTILLIVATGAAAYLLFLRRDRSMDAPPAATDAVTPSEQLVPLGAQPHDVTVPPLDESDALVRQLVAAISSHPRIAAWLATDNLIRNFTAVVHDISAGMTPSRRLQVLAPDRPFRRIDRDGVLRVDPGSYARYDGLADALSSVDAGGAARLYATLKPRIEEAYAEQGFPHVSFDRTLERAIVHLLETPIVNDTPALEPRGAEAFAFADQRLENLSSAQKHLLRTGPRNVRIVQEKLRELASALGIPAERLPQEDH